MSNLKLTVFDEIMFEIDYDLRLYVGFKLYRKILLFLTIDVDDLTFKRITDSIDKSFS
jgi:hypothetical protein